MQFEHVDPDRIKKVTRCDCGALTVEVDNENYSMRPVTFRKIFGKEPTRKKPQWWSCNHCVNHWGVDLCACGSGEPYDKCREGFDCCGQPMQVIGEYTHVRAADAIGLPHGKYKQL